MKFIYIILFLSVCICGDEIESDIRTTHLHIPILWGDDARTKDAYVLASSIY